MGSSDRIRVLLVEDNVHDARFAMAALRESGGRFEVRHVETLRAAQAWLAAEACDVILLDLSLPDSHGFATITAVQQAAPTLPVIVHTGYDDDDFGAAAVEAGTQDFLVKGQGDPTLIQRTIRHAIIRKQLEEKLRASEQRARAAMAAAEEANRAKSTFLAMMSHEIRTPLNGILGAMQLFDRHNLSPGQTTCLDTVIQSGTALLTILNDILDLSKIEAGRLDLDVKDFALRPTVGDIVDLLRPRAGSKGLRLVLDIDPRAPSFLKGDPVRLRQILSNLVGNAIKFTGAGQVVLQVEPVAGRDGEEGGGEGGVRLRFSVADTGIGIAPEHLGTLFQPFTQADSSIGRRYGGTGLGLAICKRLVDAMGGALDVASTPGRGSIFRFEVPFAPGIAPAAEAGPAAAAGPSLSVLLVEDEEVNRFVAVNLLQRLGHRVTVAADGRQAVARIAAARPGDFDVVLMDLHLPGLDGLEAARLIRDLPGGRLPILALTASALQETAERCLAVGMNGFVAKPVMLDQLAQALRSVHVRALPAVRVEGEARLHAAGEAGLVAADIVDHAFRHLGPDKAGELFRLARRAIAEAMAALRDAGRHGAREEAARLAHRLKGLAGQAGLRALSRHAVTLGDAARGGPEADLMRTIAEAEQLAARSLAELDAALTRQGMALE